MIVELNAGEEKSEYKGGYRKGPVTAMCPRPVDINLILDEEGDVLRFTETSCNMHRFAEETEKKITGKWSLSVNDDAALGTWTSQRAASPLPISLTRVDLLPDAEVPKDANPLAATYDTRWLESVNFNDAGMAKSFGDVEVRFSQGFGVWHCLSGVGQFPGWRSQGQGQMRCY